MPPTQSPSAPIRIAVVYHFLPNYRQGVFDALRAEPDTEVTFITGHSRPGQEGVQEAEGLDPIVVTNRWAAGTFLWQSGLLSALWNGKFDAVIFLGNWMWPSTWAGSLLMKARGVAVLYWTHGWTQTERGPKGFLRRLFYRMADRLLLYGERAAEIGRSHGFTDENLVVIGNSIPLPAGEADALPLDIPEFVAPELPMVLWIARLIEEKRPDLLIQAIAEAERRGTPLNVCFIGEGDQREAAQAQAEASIPGRYAFLGAIHDEGELASAFAAASVTAVPDYGGLTIPHSLVHGVPVVANDVAAANGPEYEYLYPGTNGTVFAQNDAAALAGELIRWAYENPLEGLRRNEVITRARADASPVANAERIMEAVSSSLMSSSS